MAIERNAPYVFVSYASADHERVMPLVEVLRDAGISLWIDRSGIPGGANYGLEIAEGIKGASALLLFCTASSLQSRNVKQEVMLAWKYQRPYLPLLLEPITFPPDMEYWLEGSQWVEVLGRGDADWLPQTLAALHRMGVTADRTPPSDTISPSAPAPAPRVATLPEPPPLVGRDREQGILSERFADALGGHGGLILIGGEAGIGKTALTESLAYHAAARGAAILTGRCYDLTETPPYGPWLDLFAHFRPDGTVPPPAAFAERGTVGAVERQVALFVQVEDFLAALTARRPVMLVLDDLQWADPASLNLLRFLLPALPTLRLLCVATYRADELSEHLPLAHLLPTLVRGVSTTRLDLHPLAERDIAAMVAARFPLGEGDAARLVAYVQERSEGNPFYGGELLAAIEEEGIARRDGAAWTLGDLSQARLPALVRQVIASRLDRLGDAAKALLAVGSVIGQEVPFDLWATVASTDEETLLDLVEEAGAMRALREMPDGSGVRFDHALIRAALYEGIPALRRKRIHRQVGEAVAAGRDADPDVVAFHFRQAGDARAAEWLLRAGERADEAFALETAAARFAEALPLLEADPSRITVRAEVLLRLARLRRLDGPRGIGYAREAMRLAAEAGEVALAAAARCRLGMNLCFARQYREGLAEMEAAMAALDAVPMADTDRLARLDPGCATWHIRLADYAVRLVTVGRFAEAERHALAARAEGERLHDLSVEMTVALAIAHLAMGRVAEGEARGVEIRAYWSGIREFGVLLFSILGELSHFVIPYRADQPSVRESVVASWTAAMERVAGQAPALARPALPYGLAYLAGRWDDIPPRGSRLFGLGEEYELILGKIAVARGDTETVDRIVARLVPDGLATEPGTTPFRPATDAQCLAAAFALDSGDLPAARAWLEMYDRWLAWSGAVFGRSEGALLQARYCATTGDTAGAYDHARRALAHATEPHQPLALLAAYRLLGDLDRAAARHDDAARHLDAALALADACDAPYERALTLLAMAEARATTGDTAAVRTLVDDATAILTPLGAAPALARAARIAAHLPAG